MNPPHLHPCKPDDIIRVNFLHNKDPTKPRKPYFPQLNGLSLHKLEPFIEINCVGFGLKGLFSNGIGGKWSSGDHYCVPA